MPRRIAASLAFATLFFAGAALSAGAGNGVVSLLGEGPDSVVSAEGTTSTETSAEPASQGSGESPDAAPAEPAAEPADQPAPAAEAPAPDAAAEEAEVEASEQMSPHSQAQASSEGSSSQGSKLEAAVQDRARAEKLGSGAAQNKKLAPQQGGKLHGVPADNFHGAPPVVRSEPRALRAPEREPEADEPNVAATVWLHRVLPDPTPPSRRLTPAFARRLVRISSRNHVDWALTLAVLRASGERGSVPASRAKLLNLAKALKARRSSRDAWNSVLALEGRTAFADRTIALQHLYHAVGLKALVKGFDWAKPSLSRRILNDPRISIYPGGRADIKAGRVNVRVLALIAYLAEAHGQVTVSCLISGHRLYARPGVISAHIFGLAADISMLGGTSILGHQQPDSVTEQAVRNILLLPAELQARQVISLIGMGGPSFPLSNHDDHIHVGF